MLELKSEAFKDGELIPKIYTGEGDDISPPLEWVSASDRVQEFALLCEDPDAPRDEPFVHWIAYGIPAQVRHLEEGIPDSEIVEEPVHLRQGRNSFGDIGYGGPLPSAGSGPHRYYFKLFALDQQLDLKSDLTKEEFLDAIRDHILAEAELLGKYERRSRSEESTEVRL